ncbi:MAG: HAD hydrolase-like protein, partial [Spirochaetes bacterium]|nr:HAD hydrolase-like protein [Spirochaetota bacterium]
DQAIRLSPSLWQAWLGRGMALARLGRADEARASFARALGLDYDNGARACVAWECAANACTAMPGALDFLSCCRKGGLPLGIVSNAQFYTPLFIEDAFGKRLFGGSGTPSEESLGFDPELALWSFETGRAKPDRWMFDELARRLSRRGVPADRILFIGNDALNDCAAAGEAGLRTALFCGDARSFKPRLGDARVVAKPPDTLAASWEDLRRLVCT